MKETRNQKATYCRLDVYDILEKAELERQKTDHWLPGAEEGLTISCHENFEGQWKCAVS